MSFQPLKEIHTEGALELSIWNIKRTPIKRYQFKLLKFQKCSLIVILKLHADRNKAASNYDVKFVAHAVSKIYRGLTLRRTQQDLPYHSRRPKSIKFA